jgi:hypothetical protein
VTDDPFDSPEWRRYSQRAMRELVPMIADSTVTISLTPQGETDIKFALELGLSIMMDKPIIAVVEPGTQVPARLAKVADEIVEGSWDNPERMQRRIAEALARVVREQGNS